jgi:pyrroline-5-carboxylate reductase
MHGWSSEQWTAVVTAVVGSLSAAVVSVVNAMRAQALNAKLDRHHAAQRHRHQETLAALGKAPPKKD